MNKNLFRFVKVGVIAALYVVLTVFNPFSYNVIQFRISEILVFLCFYNKTYIISLVLGCAIANMFSPLLVYDMIFGTLATLLSCILVNKSKSLYISGIFPVIFNGIIVGLELFFVLKEPLLFSIICVAIGEAVVMAVGIIIFKQIEKKSFFQTLFIDS